MKHAHARLSLLTLAALVALPSMASAQEAPAPRKAPRTPVSRQTTYDRKNDAPASRNVQGAAVAIDGERLRVNSTDLRLFGIVPPQLSASFGPQARMALDQMVTGKEVGCIVRDRSREGHLLATCRTAETEDLALALLEKGLAVAARGSLAGTELIQPYLVAEQEAQNQRLGLWSIAIAASQQTATATSTSTTTATTTAQNPTSAAAPAPKPEAAAQMQTSPTPAKQDITTNATPQSPASPAAAESRLASSNGTTTSAATSPINPAGFFTRYQIVIGNLLMLATALSVLTVFALRQRQDKRDELKAIAAALRGELMAARAVCMARIKAIVTEQDDYDATWPRLRSTLYQAYVSHIGKLGAEMARKIASIYGQASDYALYYHPGEDASQESKLPKRHALATLVAHIEEVLPRLTAIEQIGDLASAQRAVRARLGNATNMANVTARRAAALAATTDNNATPLQAVSSAPAESRLPPPQSQPQPQTETGAAQESYQETATPVYETPAPQTSVARSASVVTSIWDNLRRFTQGRNAQQQQAQAPMYYPEQQAAYEQPVDDGSYAYDENVQYQYAEEEQPQPQPAPRAANGHKTRGA